MKIVRFVCVYVCMSDDICMYDLVCMHMWLYVCGVCVCMNVFRFVCMRG